MIFIESGLVKTLKTRVLSTHSRFRGSLKLTNKVQLFDIKNTYFISIKATRKKNMRVIKPVYLLEWRINTPNIFQLVF